LRRTDSPSQAIAFLFASATEEKKQVKLLKHSSPKVFQWDCTCISQNCLTIMIQKQQHWKAKNNNNV